MKKEQFLLLKLSEECVEVAHRCSKQIQFGKNEKQRDQDKTNSQRLTEELLDLISVVKLLIEVEEIKPFDELELIIAEIAKKSKMQKYLDESYQLGELPEIKL